MSINLDQNRVLEHRDEHKSWTKAKTKQKKTQTATVMLNQDTLILLAMHTDTLNIFLFLFVLSLSLCCITIISHVITPIQKPKPNPSRSLTHHSVYIVLCLSPGEFLCTSYCVWEERE